MFSETICQTSSIDEADRDDLAREVYCLLGMPVDLVDLPGVLRRIHSAASTSSTLFLSTPNLNFLVHARSDVEFRDSMLLSDLCPADGMPIVWLARLLGVPIKERIAGSDIFAALKGLRDAEHPLKLFLFGGNEGVAAAASEALNASGSGLSCVGWHFPGFFSVEELSNDLIIDAVNSREADFLVVCLGSKKGQLWLKNNFGKLRAPVRAHLGASLNFAAGTVKRAPPLMQKFGLEWLWRIKEEPYLWRRYWQDGQILMSILYSQILPLVFYKLSSRSLFDTPLTVECETQADCARLKLSGAATIKNITEIVAALRTTLSTSERVTIDVADVSAVDQRFLGALLVFRKMLRSRNVELLLTGVSPKLERVFRLNGASFMLSKGKRRPYINPHAEEAISFAKVIYPILPATERRAP